MGIVLAVLFAVVLLIVVAGEWLGALRILEELVPLPIGIVIVIAAGWPVFRAEVILQLG